MPEEKIIRKMQNDPDLQQKIKVLSLASEINPKFKNPNICGGYLRDIVLDKTPTDCDVVFEGYMRNQPGVLECVREAEKKLGAKPFEDWEFENFKATGVTGKMFDDVIGFYSNHTDYLTLLLCDTEGNIQIGSENTIKCLNERLYDIKYQGLMAWMGFRERTYFRSLAGLACRGIYLCHKLNLNISESAQDLFNHFDNNFEKLTKEEKTSLLGYWNKKTKNLKNVDLILKRFNIKNLVPVSVD